MSRNFIEDCTGGTDIFRRAYLQIKNEGDALASLLIEVARALDEEGDHAKARFFQSLAQQSRLFELKTRAVLAEGACEVETPDAWPR